MYFESDDTSPYSAAKVINIVKKKERSVKNFTIYAEKHVFNEKLKR